MCSTARSSRSLSRLVEKPQMKHRLNTDGQRERRAYKQLVLHDYMTQFHELS